MRALRHTWQGFILAALMALGVAVTAPSLAPADSTPVAKYEAANFTVSGGDDAFLRKTGNNPRFTSEGSLLVMYGTYGTGQPPQTASYTADTPAHGPPMRAAIRPATAMAASVRSACSGFTAHSPKRRIAAIGIQNANGRCSRKRG